MNTSGEAAEQVVRMMLEGTEVLLKLTGSGAKNAAILLYSIAKEQNKTRGSERLSNMLRSGKPLKVYTFKRENLEQFKKCSKEYGILYTVLKEKDDKDGMFDVLVRADDDGKLARVIQRFNLTNIDTATLRSQIVKERTEKEQGADGQKEGESPETIVTEGTEEAEKEQPEREQPNPNRNRADADALLGKGENENQNPTEARKDQDPDTPLFEEGKAQGNPSREASPEALTEKSSLTRTEKADESTDLASVENPSYPSLSSDGKNVKRKSVIKDIEHKRRQRSARAKQRTQEALAKAPAKKEKPKEK